MTHTHNTHYYQCAHASVKYCSHCNLVYCEDCTQEWTAKSWYNITYTAQPATYQIYPVGGANTTGSVSPNSAPSTTTCGHAH